MIASLCLVLGGAVLVAASLAQATSQRRILAGRMARLRFAAPTSITAPQETLDRASDQDRLRRFFSYGLKQTWGVRRSGSTLLVVAAVASIVAFALALPFGLAPWLSVPLALLVGYGVCRLLIAAEQRRVELLFVEHFPGALDTIVRVLRAGLPIPAAIRAVTEEAPEAVSRVFVELADQLDIGVSMSDALANATSRVHLSDFRFFTVSVALQHATGGNLASTLETLIDIIRRRRGVRLKVKALTAEVRMSAFILAALPFLILIGLSFIVPSYLTPLFHDPRGKLILAVGAFNLGAGFLTMRMLMRRAALD